MRGILSTEGPRGAASGPGSGRAGIPGSGRRGGLLGLSVGCYKDGSTEFEYALISRSGLESEDLGADEAKISKALMQPLCGHAKPLGRAGLHSWSHPCPRGP